jgi:hypothetical protein
MDITPHFRQEPATMNPFTADDQRLKELILHIAARCGDWEAFDVSLLDRILFQADFLHFRLYGYPVTGQTYVRGIRAPSPENRRRTTRLLVQAGEMEIQERPLGDGLHVRMVPVALREPDLRGFDGQEIAIAERVLRFYRDAWTGGWNRMLGQEGPDLVELPWELAGPGEEIPYCLALVGIASSYAFTGRDPSRNPVLMQTRQPPRLLERTP